MTEMTRSAVPLLKPGSLASSTGHHPSEYILFDLTTYHGST
jgi:hypothetical protein